VSTPCLTCGFTLWSPIEPTPTFAVSELSLYSDARFTGRCILRLNQHAEQLDELEPELAAAFMQDIQTAGKAIREVTGAERVNLSILGNTVPHLHAHLIPRYPALEEKPGKSPWDDPRPKTELTVDTRSMLLHLLRVALQS
jgi:diadenosine tetraphosphate (Ap4A) HIT family hydrolase